MRYSKLISLLILSTYFASISFVQAQPKNVSEATTRDPYLWPFAATSIWNMPIGSNANYVPANLEMPTAKMLTLDEDLIVFTPDEPNMNLYWSSVLWGTGDRCTPTQRLQLQGSVPIPQSFVVSPTTWDGTKPNAGIAVLLKDKHTIWQSQPFAHCSNGSDATTGYVYSNNQDIYAGGYSGCLGLQFRAYGKGQARIVFTHPVRFVQQHAGIPIENPHAGIQEQGLVPIFE